MKNRQAYIADYVTQIPIGTIVQARGLDEIPISQEAANRVLNNILVEMTQEEYESLIKRDLNPSCELIKKGLKKAKAKGVVLGRPKTEIKGFTKEWLFDLKEMGYSISNISNITKLSRGMVQWRKNFKWGDGLIQTDGRLRIAR